MQEIWKNISGYKNYQVSNFGRIKSLNYNKTKYTKILKPDIRRDYLSVTLYKNGVRNRFQVHRLVAIIFLPNINNLPCVNHIDGNKQNNRIDNLEWCTYKENINHSIKINLRNFNMDKNPNAKKINQYDMQGKFIRQWNCMKEITNELKIARQEIYKCCIGTLKSTKGYIWKYANK